MYDYSGRSTTLSQPMNVAGVEIRPLMRLVYLWMGLGLLVTGFIAWFVASNEELLFSVANMGIVLFIVQIGIVIGLSWAINKISPTVATGLFFAYAASMGLTLSVIVYAYVSAGEAMAIAQAFFTTAGLFGVMTVIGFTTNVDLSKFGTFLMMGLIGIILASIVNIFLGSSTLTFIISIIGVLIFTGLTAYDTQKIKEMAALPEMQAHSDMMVRLSIMGALTLYLDFINLFLFLLRLFGSSRD